MQSLTWDGRHGRIGWDRVLSDPVVVRLGGQRRAGRNERVISVAEIGPENRQRLCIGVCAMLGVEPAGWRWFQSRPWDCQGASRAVLVTG